MFGSERMPDSNEINVIKASYVAPELASDIAAFDWWVMNGDRTLTEAGGNPNILWSETENSPFVIDHNLAFDDGLALFDLLQTHVYRDKLLDITRSAELQNAYSHRFDAILDRVSALINEIPERWNFEDDSLSVPIKFSLASVARTLSRHHDQDFWGRI